MPNWLIITLSGAVGIGVGIVAANIVHKMKQDKAKKEAEAAAAAAIIAAGGTPPATN